MSRTRDTATDVRNFLAGRMGVTVPENFALTLGDAQIGDLPHKYMGPQRVRQSLIARRPRIKRPQTAVGPRSQTVSSKIEAPLNAIMEDRRAGAPWDDDNDLLLIEGLAFGTVATDVTGKPGSPVLYMPGRPLTLDNVERRFRYDHKGRFEDDDGFEGTDLDEARKTLRAEMDHEAACNLPFRQRSYSIRQCAPVWGPVLELEGLVIESHWSQRRVNERGLIVTSDKGGANLYPLGAIGEGDSSAATGDQLRVIEYWHTNDDGEPCVSYCVDGKYTWREGKNGLEAHTVNLARLAKDGKGNWKGLTRLPITWGWGLGWSAAELDDRALSFVKPFLQSWRNIDSLVTMSLIWCSWRAFPALIEEVPLGTPMDAGIDEDDDPEIPDIQPMKITRVRGKITEVGTTGIDRSMFDMVSLMLGENKAEAPGSGDSQGGASGFAMSLAQAFEQDALTTVHEAAKRMYAERASFVLEGAKVIGETTEAVRVYEISEEPIAQGRPSPVNQLLILEPDLIGTSFTTDAISKPSLSPADKQQNAEFVERRIRSKRWEMEQAGIESPETMLNEIAYEDLLDSDAGKAVTYKLLQQFVENEFTKQIQEAMAAGEANGQGLPVGYTEGLAGPPPDLLMPGVGAPEGGGMTGLSVPSPAAASLAGSIGGGLQNGPVNNAVTAGGVLPAAPMQGA
jgi:hypothetical protein